MCSGRERGKHERGSRKDCLGGMRGSKKEGETEGEWWGGWRCERGFSRDC